MLIGSQELIHDINSQLVLTHIINEGPISRASLAKSLGLTKATISSIVQELIDKFLVIEIGSDNTSRGRKPILLTFNPHCGQVITLNLEEEMITLMTCYLNGESYQTAYYPNNKTDSDIILHLIRIIESTLTDMSQSQYGVVGIAIGIHGVVHQNRILFTPYSSYSCVDFVGALESHFDIPVYLENEANLSIIGEKTFGYHYANMLGISIHSGIGLGLIMNHELFSGYNGNAGEFGHTIIEPNGRPCPCGNLGCFEQYASERSLLLDFARSKGIPKASLPLLIEAYHQQDPIAISLMSQFTTYMAMGINNMLNFFNPEVIVINSSLIYHLPHLLDEIHNLLQNRMKDFCHLVPSKLLNDSVLFGGLYICTQKFLGVKKLNFTLDSKL